MGRGARGPRAMGGVAWGEEEHAEPKEMPWGISEGEALLRRRPTVRQALIESTNGGGGRNPAVFISLGLGVGPPCNGWRCMGRGATPQRRRRVAKRSPPSMRRVSRRRPTVRETLVKERKQPLRGLFSCGPRRKGPPCNGWRCMGRGATPQRRRRVAKRSPPSMRRVSRRRRSPHGGGFKEGAIAGGGSV